jgi:arylformamidase
VSLTFEHRGQRYTFDPAAGISLAIPLDFSGRQPAYFGVEPAREMALEAGEFVGDTRRGGSCNVARLELVPHCHGTHTESVSHLVSGQLQSPQPPPWLPARIVSVTPETLGATEERYPSPGEVSEAVISRKALSAFDIDTQALVVRTLPNDPAKREKTFEGDNPHPYFTLDAIEWLVDRGVEHLLVDTPSIDRGHDDGTLPAHRRFWALDEERRPTDENALARTITEFVFVPKAAHDGLYLLNLQVPDWHTDAVPSRPVVFPLARGGSIGEDE